MAKAKFPKELKCQEIEVTNKNWLDEFKSATNFVESYYTVIENFFKFCEYKDKPFNVFSTYPDIEKYVEVMLKNQYTADSINTLNGALSGFKAFLIKQHPTIFAKDFLFDLHTLRFDDDNPSDAFALNLDQINHIREYNKGDIWDEYIFEIYFQLCIRKKEIVICHPNNNDAKSSCFKANGKEIKYNTKIAELLGRLPSTAEKRFTPEIANSYFLKVTKYLRIKSVYDKERLLNYSDLTQSHTKYIFKCPNCGELTENTAKSWVLVKRELDADYRLVCSKCKGALNEN